MEINGDVTMETNDKRTRSENRASQQIDQGLLTFANIWFVWFKTSYDGDKWICHPGDRQTDRGTNGK